MQQSNGNLVTRNDQVEDLHNSGKMKLLNQANMVKEDKIKNRMVGHFGRQCGEQQLNLANKKLF